MIKIAAPHFVIKNKFQKGGLYEDLLTPAILSDICLTVAGRPDYTCEFDNEGYNVGRLAILEYDGVRTYVSVSETVVRSRNASFQSLPSAVSRYILDRSPKKDMCFYIHPSAEGNFETDYFIFMYRLMKTSGVRLINVENYIGKQIEAFASVDDLINYREQMRRRSRGNNSSYITRGPSGTVQIYGKTYGANKYETTLLCFAASQISGGSLELYEVAEGGLSQLPQISKMAIASLRNVNIFTSDDDVEAADFNDNDSLRSARFIFNLLERLGKKKCAFCECRIPQIIQGAHIWPVAAIKRDDGLNFDEKLRCALDGNNGLWLCENHHKLLDSGTLFLSRDRSIKYKGSPPDDDKLFIEKITPFRDIPDDVVHVGMLDYIDKRNAGVLEERYMKVGE